MLEKNTAFYKRLKTLCKYNTPPTCPVCKEKINLADANETEYIKTRLGKEIFIHTACVKNY